MIEKLWLNFHYLCFFFFCIVIHTYTDDESVDSESVGVEKRASRNRYVDQRALEQLNQFDNCRHYWPVTLLKDNRELLE